jgi:hypothetical protein
MTLKEEVSKEQARNTGITHSLQRGGDYGSPDRLDDKDASINRGFEKLQPSMFYVVPRCTTTAIASHSHFVIQPVINPLVRRTPAPNRRGLTVGGR